MQIYTSYFSKLSKITNPVSICGKAPDWYTGPQFKKLAPKYGFFKDYKDGKIDSTEYTKQFYEQVLSSLTREDVLFALNHFYPNAKEVTLLCYEKPSDFCHRHIVADWLNEGGIDVKEKDV